MNIRTRFAPSPTGYLHVGGLRTALYAFLFVKKEGGELILRIEDTDRSRYVPGAIESLITVLDRVGIEFDEGPVLKDGKVEMKGDKGPYIQSERLEIYKEHAQILIDGGHAYYCFCSKDRLDSLRKQQQIAKMQPKYDRACCKLSDDEVNTRLSANEPHVVRLKVPEGKTVIEDMIRGKVVVENKEIDDQVLMKSDGFPTYHLAVVVDDHLMEITHVIRAEEWLSSTPKHIILHEMFGWDLPVYAHLPLILNPDKSKLSKRQGDVAVEDFIDKGYLPEALINFVALLGFNPKADQEIYSISELIESFELSKVNKSGAVFNTEKLDWMNGQYIRQKSADELADLVRPFLERAGKSVENDLLVKICAIEMERMTLLGDLNDEIDGYTTIPEYDPIALVWKKADEKDAAENLEGIASFLSDLDEDKFGSVELVETAIKGYISSKGLKNGNVLWPLRVALSGRTQSPSPFELAWVFGKKETLTRINTAHSLLKES